MHERGGLKRVAGLFAGHLRAGELAQFGIDEREQFLPGAGIPVLDGFEKTGDVAHARQLGPDA